jgi:AraC family transcriptional regulator
VNAGEITLVDAAKGEGFPAARSGSILSSSAPLGWRGIAVERHRLVPQELPEHYVVGHGLAVSTGSRPIRFGWRHGLGSWKEGVLNPGEFHLLTHGDLNTPHWLDTFDEVTLVLDRRFVADVVKEDLPEDRIVFMSQRSRSDPIVARYAGAFREEMEARGPNGALYADTLAIGFVLHLLTHYAVARPTVPAPKGKLNSFQLRSVVELIHDQLDEDLSLVVLAERANVSPFHFARLFRATVGVTPHQFVLHQRVQRSLALIKAGGRPLAQIAIDCGFHDQPHFTRAFRKLVGTTPAKFLVGK